MCGLTTFTTGCPYPHLPTTLDTIGYLNFQQEFHTASGYRVNFTQGSEFTTFTLEQRTTLRINVQKNGVDIFLILYSQDNTVVAVRKFFFLQIILK